MKVARENGRANAVDKYIYVFGGSNGTQWINNCEQYIH